MGTFRELFERKYDALIDKLAAEIASTFRRQAPQRGRTGPSNEVHPYATGRLYKSIRWETQDGNIVIKYNKYGDYTSYGTLQANSQQFGVDLFELSPYIGYRENPALLGIMPQFWTSLEGRRDLIDEIERSVTEAIIAGAAAISTDIQ